MEFDRLYFYVNDQGEVFSDEEALDHNNVDWDTLRMLLSTLSAPSNVFPFNSHTQDETLQAHGAAGAERAAPGAAGVARM